MISGRLEGLSMQECVLRANAIGSMQVVVPGDNDGFPDRENYRLF